MAKKIAKTALRGRSISRADVRAELKAHGYRAGEADITAVIDRRIAINRRAAEKRRKPKPEPTPVPTPISPPEWGGTDIDENVAWQSAKQIAMVWGWDGETTPPAWWQRTYSLAGRISAPMRVLIDEMQGDGISPAEIIKGLDGVGYTVTYGTEPEPEPEPEPESDSDTEPESDSDTERLIALLRSNPGLSSKMLKMLELMDEI